MKKILSTFAAAIAFILAPAVQAAVITLPVQTSGYGFMFGNDNVVPDQSRLNATSYIGVRNNQSTGPYDDMQGLLRFDTRAVSALFNAGDKIVIDSARLELQFIGHWGDPTTTTMRVGLGKNDSWLNNALSAPLWNQYSEDLSSKVFTAFSPMGMYSFALNGLDFADIGADQLVSFLLFADRNASSNYNELGFNTGSFNRNASDVAPRLVLDVSRAPADVPEPGSFALVALALAALAVQRKRSA
jgi:hypothetical protein